MAYNNLSVLLVEDTKSCIDLYNVVVESISLNNIDFASNQAEAVALLQGKQYQVLLCDTMHETQGAYGPRIVEKARELGQNPFVVALSSLEEHVREWEGVPYDLFTLKNYLYDEQTLADILKLAEEKLKPS
ncbi:hypothetical protein JXA85_00655 [Candidatus Woesearchaeota archaeon]|nr:hypothetical protein [Candidatus Woesearchaeota archaeon]